MDMGFAGTILGALIGGTASYFGSVGATNKGIKAQNRVFEENEKLIVKENAIIVYYDLLLGLNDIKKLFLNRCVYENIQPKRMYFSNDWIKNVAIISRDVTINQKINDIYNLYGELLTIKSFLEEDLTSNNIKNDMVLGVDRIAKLIMKNETYDRFNINIYNKSNKDKIELDTLINENIITDNFLKKDYRTLLETIKLLAL